MKRTLNVLFLALIITVAFATPASAATSAELKSQYKDTTAKKIKILIVPGHDDEYWGTEFGDTRESDVVVAIGEHIYNFIKNDPRFEVVITRTQQGYTPTFANYFVNERANIETFMRTKIAEANRKKETGEVKEVEGVYHNKANPEVAIRLYGINKWANENDVDIALHLHINDHGGRKWGVIGDYEGFTIYVPESQYKNAALTKGIADELATELKHVMAVSNLPGEDLGVTEDQGLIAIGASDTLEDTAAMLVEYGYIYEPQWLDVSVREKVAEDYAFRTALGLYRFFGNRQAMSTETNTTLLPHKFTRDLKSGLKFNLDVVALQAALRSQGLYPSGGMSHSDCPVSGNFGNCTKKAVVAFQKKYKIAQTGTVGPATRAKLNTLFGK